jgi:hypothetical protein
MGICNLDKYCLIGFISKFEMEYMVVGLENRFLVMTKILHSFEIILLSLKFDLKQI